MEASQIYISISIIALLIIGAVIFFVRKDRKGARITPIGGLSLMFVLAGIIFGENKWVGYSFIGAGVLLAVIDIIIKLNKSRK